MAEPEFANRAPDSQSSAETVIARDDPIAVAECQEQHVWNAYVADHEFASAYHDFGFLKAIDRAFSRQIVPLYALKGDRCVGVLPLVRLKSFVFGDFLVGLPYVTYGGILADDDAARHALAQAAIAKAKRLGCKHLELRHTAPLPGFDERMDKISMVLPLPEESETLFSSIGSKLRAQVRRPRKAGAESFVGGAELLDDFYAIISRKYRDLGVPIYSKRWFRTLLEWQPKETRIAAVRLDDKIVAAGLILKHRDTMEVPYAASIREYDRQSVNMLLYWEMMEESIRQKVRFFDFGRTTPDSGTHRFKRQWGAEPRQLYWHYWMRDGGDAPKLNADNGKYGMAVKMWRKLPVRIASLIGPHIVKNLP